MQVRNSLGNHLWVSPFFIRYITTNGHELLSRILLPLRDRLKEHNALA